MFFFKKIVFLVSVILLSSCAAIPGEVDVDNKPSPKGTGKALIYGESLITGKNLTGQKLGMRIFILSLDGKSLHRMRYSSDYPEALLITPGKHEISVKYTVGSRFAFSDLWFDAEAGQTYVVRGKTIGYGVSMWVENEETKERVGGLTDLKTPEKDSIK